MPKNAYIIVILAAILAAALLYLNPQITGRAIAIPQVQTVRVGYVPLAYALPYFVAQEEGYFAEEGLDVKAIRFESPNQLIDAIAAGQVDLSGGPVAATGIAAIAEDRQPGLLRIYSLGCPGVSNPAARLLVARDSPVRSLADLKGRRMGKLPGIQWKTLITRYLEVNGVDPASVELVDLAVPLQLGALQSGSIDAVMALEPVPTIARLKNVSRVLDAAPMETSLVEPLCVGAGVVNARFLVEKPGVARKAFSAIEKGIRRTRSDESVRRYMEKYLGLDEQTALAVQLPTFVLLEELTPKHREAAQKFVDLFWQANVTKNRVLVERMLA